MDVRMLIVDGDVNPASEEEVTARLLAEFGAAGKDDAFYVLRVEDLVKQYAQWMEQMPRVHPFYAMKCNSSEPVMRALVALGCGLDVATDVEIRQAIDTYQLPPEKLIFSNTCKTVSHVLYAQEKGVNLTTFDTESELLKMQLHFPTSGLLVRLRCADDAVHVPMGQHFGCDMGEAKKLVDLCVERRLNLVGVHFHVGCGSTDPFANYGRAIKNSRILFDYAGEQGVTLRVLNIGGGFPGAFGDITIPLRKYSNAINDALAEHFPLESGVQVIAEPGQYFTASAQSLFASVIGIKKDPNSSNPVYVVNDGRYGSFCSYYHQVAPDIRVHQLSAQQTSSQALTRQPSDFWGPTCNPYDKITQSAPMPTLRMGQWVEFKRMGAYSNELFSSFNGFRKPNTVVLVPQRHLHLLQNAQEEEKSTKKSVTKASSNGNWLRCIKQRFRRAFTSFG